MSRFLGITRERVFSPGKVEADAAVLETVAARLRASGHIVSVCSADAPRWPEPDGARAVFAMCQGAVALERLARWAAAGLRIVNSPQGILNCQRHRTIALLAQAGVPFPPSVLVHTGEPAALPAWVGGGGAWVKRGDFHATQAADVVQVDGIAAAHAALNAFEARGIHHAVVQQHVAGTVLKFYGVRDAFFHCVPPPGEAPLAAAGLACLRALAERAAHVLGVEIYGGDCVYDSSGGFALIDLNDWPSYASCCAEAATYIAAYLDARDVASER